jgi:hypothetical protein
MTIKNMPSMKKAVTKMAAEDPHNRQRKAERNRGRQATAKTRAAEVKRTLHNDKMHLKPALPAVQRQPPILGNNRNGKTRQLMRMYRGQEIP